MSERMFVSDFRPVVASVLPTRSRRSLPPTAGQGLKCKAGSILIITQKRDGAHCSTTSESAPSTRVDRATRPAPYLGSDGVCWSYSLPRRFPLCRGGEAEIGERQREEQWWSASNGGGMWDVLPCSPGLVDVRASGCTMGMVSLLPPFQILRGLLRHCAF